MFDTIAAISTAYGEGGIGIIRISGENSYDIMKKVFVPFNDSKEIIPRKLTYGHIVDENGVVIDEVMTVFMNKPHTYTAEDVVEINCHGSIVSLRNTLSLVLRQGAVLAEPGEFTKRAFLNGRLDLSQAEAVIDMIKAKTDVCFDVALNQLDGAFSADIQKIRDKLVDILVNVTVNIDYPDEDIEQLTFNKLIEDLLDVKSDVNELLSTFERGKLLKEGLAVSIIGRPNVGKSSLMNALLNETRAIVTDIPGTTRDTIEEQINVRGIPVILTDTAGIRNTNDKIEKIGIEKSKESFNNADLIIFIIDGSNELEDDDIYLMKHVGSRKCIVLVNKKDIDIKVRERDVLEYIPDASVVYSSIVNNDGIKEVEDIIEHFVYGGEVKQSESSVVSNARHADLLRRADMSLEDALRMANSYEPLEFIEVDINSCYELLGEIIGESVSDDIINEVFSRFCLGK